MSSLLVYSTCNQMQRDLFSVRFTLWLLDKEVPSLSWLMPEPRISVRNQVQHVYGSGHPESTLAKKRAQISDNAPPGGSPGRKTT